MSIKTEEEVKKWRSRIETAVKGNQPRLDDQKKAVAAYELNKPSKDGIITTDEDTEGRKKNPIIYDTFSLLIPSLLARLPEIRVDAMTAEGMEQGPIIEKVVKQLAKEIFLYEEILRTVKNAVIEGEGFVKIGYAPIMEKVEGEWVLYEDRVFVENIPNKDIILDTEARSFEACKFIGYKLTLSKAEVKARWPDANTEKMCSYTLGGEKAEDIGENKDNKRYLIFEIWSKSENMYFVMADGYTDSFLEKKPWPYDLKDYPFEMMVFDEEVGTFRGFNEINIHEGSVDDINFMEELQRESAEQAPGITLAQNGGVTDDEAKAITSPESGKRLVFVNNIEAFNSLRFEGVSAETFKLRDDKVRQIRETTHTSDQRRQGKGKSGTTATEAAIAQQHSGVLTGFKSSQVERFIERVIEKLMAIVSEFFDEPRTIKIENKFTGEVSFSEWQGTNIAQFDYKVSVGSAAAQNTTIEISQTQQSLALIERMSMAGIIPNPRPGARYLTRKMLSLQRLDPAIVDQMFQEPQVPYLNQQGNQGSGESGLRDISSLQKGLPDVGKTFIP
jgi:hypothetical protein